MTDKQQYRPAHKGQHFELQSICSPNAAQHHLYSLNLRVFGGNVDWNEPRRQAAKPIGESVTLVVDTALASLSNQRCVFHKIRRVRGCANGGAGVGR